MHKKILVALFTLCLPLLTQAQALKVVASFSILGDFVQEIGQDKISLHTLVGRDSDAHVFQPSPADAKKLAEAQLVIVNGLGFEGWIDRLIKSSGYKGPLAVASEGISPLHASDDHGGHDHGVHNHESTDPHAWLNVRNALKYVDNITNALIKADAKNSQFYQDNANRYKQKLEALDLEIKKNFSSIPKEKRKIVSSHDAFSYYGSAYEISFTAPVGINNEAESSAETLAKIIRQIKKEKIRAVFLENISNSRVLEQLRRETKVKIGGTLYADSLSKQVGLASSYIELMRHNTKVIIGALKEE